MNTTDLLSKIRLITTIGVFAIVLMLTSAKINHAIFTSPARSLYVTAKYKDDKKTYDQQEKAYEEACNPARIKQSYLHITTAILFLLIAILLHNTSFAIAFTIASLWELFLVCIGSWDLVGVYILIACLVVALGLLGFSLYQQDTKK